MGPRRAHLRRGRLRGGHDERRARLVARLPRRRGKRRGARSSPRTAHRARGRRPVRPTSRRIWREPGRSGEPRARDRRYRGRRCWRSRWAARRAVISTAATTPRAVRGGTRGRRPRRRADCRQCAHRSLSPRARQSPRRALPTRWRAPKPISPPAPTASMSSAMPQRWAAVIPAPLDVTRGTAGMPTRRRRAHHHRRGAGAGRTVGGGGACQGFARHRAGSMGFKQRGAVADAQALFPPKGETDRSAIGWRGGAARGPVGGGGSAPHLPYDRTHGVADPRRRRGGTSSPGCPARTPATGRRRRTLPPPTGCRSRLASSITRAPAFWLLYRARS